MRNNFETPTTKFSTQTNNVFAIDLFAKFIPIFVFKSLTGYATFPSYSLKLLYVIKRFRSQETLKMCFKRLGHYFIGKSVDEKDTCL